MSSHALWRVLSKKINPNAWSLLSWHPTHTYLWGRLCFIQVVCSPRSRSRRVTQIMSTEALLLNGFDRNPQKPTSTTLCIRSACEPGSRRTKSLQTVATRVVPATGSCYSARVFRCRRVQMWTKSRVGREILVAWTEQAVSKRQILQALGAALSLLYDDCYKLFWNWNDVVRFVFQKVWFDKEFVIWHFLNYCMVQIVLLWSFSIGVRIILTTNE